jgi:hypothetical protein
MEGKRVVIKVGKDGSLKVEAQGFKGPDCLKKTEWISERYGSPKTELKDSYYQEETVLKKDGLPSGWCG